MASRPHRYPDAPMIAHDGPFFNTAYRAMQTVTGEPGGSEAGRRRINGPPAPAPAPKTSIGAVGLSPLTAQVLAWSPSRPGCARITCFWNGWRPRVPSARRRQGSPARPVRSRATPPRRAVRAASDQRPSDARPPRTIAPPEKWWSAWTGAHWSAWIVWHGCSSRSIALYPHTGVSTPL